MIDIIDYEEVPEIRNRPWHFNNLESEIWNRDMVSGYLPNLWRLSHHIGLGNWRGPRGIMHGNIRRDDFLHTIDKVSERVVIVLVLYSPRHKPFFGYAREWSLMWFIGARWSRDGREFWKLIIMSRDILGSFRSLDGPSGWCEYFVCNLSMYVRSRSPFILNGGGDTPIECSAFTNGNGISWASDSLKGLNHNLN